MNTATKQHPQYTEDQLHDMPLLVFQDVALAILGNVDYCNLVKEHDSAKPPIIAAILKKQQ